MKNKKRGKFLAGVMGFVMAVNVSLPMYIVNAQTVGIEDMTENEGKEQDSTWNEKLTDETQVKVVEIEETGEKAKVYIWYNDINQNKVDSEVKKEIGLSRDDINTDLPMPDVDVIENIQKVYANNFAKETERKECEEEMQNYLEETKEAREKESKLTEVYVSQRREIAKSEYAKESDRIIDELGIQSEDVVYVSKFAPMIIAKMTSEEIIDATKNAEIKSIELCYDDQYVPLENEETIVSVNEWKKTNGFDIVSEKRGLTGKGVKLAILDMGLVKADEQIPTERLVTIGTSNSTDEHQMRMAYIAAGTNGIASGAHIYSMDVESVGLFQAVETLIENQVDVINYSVGHRRLTGEEYDTTEKWLDHIARVHNITFVCASGNTGKNIIHPAQARNVITVGSLDDNSTVTKLDDVLYDYSSYDNSSGCSKPDLIVSGNVLFRGTSSATAAVSGIVALLFEMKPALRSSPEAVKAILLASCHSKAIDPVACEITETMQQGITDKQGAGILDISAVFNIVANNQYGTAIISGDSLSETIEIKYEPLSYANVSAAWIQNNTINAEEVHDENSIDVGMIQDLNLSVRCDSDIVCSGDLDNSSTEMVYFPLSENSLYQINLTRITDSDEEVRVGYAWSTMADQVCPKGDFNLNMETNNIDAELILYNIFKNNKTSDLQKYLSDIDGNGVITIADLKSYVKERFFVDINQNGIYTETDLYDALYHIAGLNLLPENQWKQFDFNRNGKADEEDFNMLLYGYYLNTDTNPHFTSTELYTEFLPNLYDNLIIGDMDMSQVIDETDLTLFRDAVEGKTNNCLYYILADVNHDLKLDQTDINIFESEYISDIPFEYILDETNKMMTITGVKDASITCVEIAESYTVNCITYSVSEIAENAFSKCVNLEEVYIPDSVTTIAGNTAKKSPFYGVTNNVLKIYCEVMTAPDGYAEKWAYCQRVQYGYNIKNAEEYFYYTVDEFSKTMTITGVRGKWYKSTNGVITVDDRYLINGTEYHVTTIDDYAFSYVGNGGEIKSIYLPAGILTIGQNAFSHNEYLEDVDLGRCIHLKEIKASAFAYCSHLDEIWIPDSVEIIHSDTVEDSIFYQCDENLLIYTSAPEMKELWGKYWNYINENMKAEVAYQSSVA